MSWGEKPSMNRVVIRTLHNQSYQSTSSSESRLLLSKSASQLSRTSLGKKLNDLFVKNSVNGHDLLLVLRSLWRLYNCVNNLSTMPRVKSAAVLCTDSPPLGDAWSRSSVMSSFCSVSFTYRVSSVWTASKTLTVKDFESCCFFLFIVGKLLARVWFEKT